MTKEPIPVVDLRLLSQSDLTALSLSSPASFDLSHTADVVIPKIDRSVFNESAGSRKQTYSRLRLAKPSTPSPSTQSHRENDLIVTLLRRLFDPAPIKPYPEPQSHVLALAAPPSLCVSPDEASRALVLVENGDNEFVNVKGEVVDVVRLAEKEDPFGGELRKRTAGMKTEEELLGFLGGMEGQWGSRRKKRKIVDAVEFGDDLPRGWKVLLGLKRKEGVAWLHCRRYVSPLGKQFVSCKEVALYMYSLLGHQDASHQISGQDGNGNLGLDKSTPGCAAGSTSQADQEKPSALFRAEKQAIEPKKVLECHKCNLTFCDKDSLVQHLLSFHQRSTKRRRLGKSVGNGVIVKDGKYECQFCHKVFLERHRYNGHVGSHVRYQGLSSEAFLNESSMGKIINPTPLASMPFSETEDPKIIQNTKYDAPETSQIGCTSKSIDDPISEDDAKVLSPSRIDANSAAPDCPRDISQEDSASKPVDGQINDINMNGYKSEEIAEKSNVEVMSPTEHVNTTSPLRPNVADIEIVTIPMSKPVVSQIIDFDMNGCKPEVTVEDGSVRAIKSSEFLNATSDSLKSMDNGTLNPKSEENVNSSNSTVMEPKSCLDALSPSLEEASIENGLDHVICENLNENGLLSSISKSIVGADGCDITGYESEEMVDASNSTDMELNRNSCLDALSPSLINLDMTCEASNEIDLSSGTMVPRIENYGEEQNIDSENDMLEEMNDLSNELENCFHRSEAEDYAGNVSGVDGRSLLHVDVSETSWVHSSDGLPILDMIPEQDEDGLNAIGEKLGDISGYGEMRLDVSQPMEFIFMSGEETLPSSQPTDELGYVAELGSGGRPSIELDWGLSSPLKIARECNELKAACMWCGREFNRGGISSAELESDMVGFICPTCKKNISGQTQM